ncbi:MAG: hypothetical protein ACMUIU_01195 [bacterium]
MLRYYSILAIVIICILFSSGCAHKPSQLEMNYGTSFFLSKFNQTLNHEIEKNPGPVNGFDGQVAMEVMERYRKGFEKQQEVPNYTFNIK